MYFILNILVLFNDEASAEEILNCDDPREQKSLGRKVDNFDDNVWTKKCRDIVKDGNKAKVSQMNILTDQINYLVISSKVSALIL